MRLPRVRCRGSNKSALVGGHRGRDEQQISGFDRLLLITECGCNTSIDMVFARGAIGPCGDHIDFDFAVVRRKPVFDAWDNRDSRSRCAEMPCPGLMEC